MMKIQDKVQSNFRDIGRDPVVDTSNKSKSATKEKEDTFCGLQGGFFNGGNKPKPLPTPTPANNPNNNSEQPAQLTKRSTSSIGLRPGFLIVKNKDKDTPAKGTQPSPGGLRQ